MLKDIAGMKAQFDYTFPNGDRIVLLSPGAKQVLIQEVMASAGEKLRCPSASNLRRLEMCQRGNTLLGIKLFVIESPALEELYGSEWWSICPMSMKEGE